MLHFLVRLVALLFLLPFVCLRGLLQEAYELGRWVVSGHLRRLRPRPVVHRERAVAVGHAYLSQYMPKFQKFRDAVQEAELDPLDAAFLEGFFEAHRRWALRDVDEGVREATEIMHEAASVYVGAMLRKAADGAAE